MSTLGFSYFVFGFLIILVLVVCIVDLVDAARRKLFLLIFIQAFLISLSRDRERDRWQRGSMDVEHTACKAGDSVAQNELTVCAEA